MTEPAPGQERPAVPPTTSAAVCTTQQDPGPVIAHALDQCAVHKHSPTYGEGVCPDCQRFVPDPTKVLTAYHKAVSDAQGCTEMTCLYHHYANVTRRDLEHVMRVMGWTA